ncbi:MAG: hypothetical protein MJZ95_06025 [Paludibacteraceae bacterium]|nr:hypothetical protein [Paludibacteraceae bacterium]
MKVKERILRFCELKGIKKKDLAKYTEIAATNFANSAMKSDINCQPIVRFLSEFPEISAEWLMRGEGPMLRQDSPPDPSISQTIHGNVTNSSISQATVPCGSAAGSPAPVPRGSASGLNSSSSSSSFPLAPVPASSAGGYLPTCIPDSCPLMNAKDVTIQAKIDLISAKDDTIRSKDDTIAAQTATIAALSQTIRTLQDTLASLRP